MQVIKNPMRIWRTLTDLLTVIAFIVSIEDFRTNGGMENILGPIMAIYVVVLAIFSAEKEFERWYFYNLGRHRGEIYVWTWTILVIGIFSAVFVTGSDYRMSPEIFSTYTAVLGVLAITRRSKEIFQKKHPEK